MMRLKYLLFATAFTILFLQNSCYEKEKSPTQPNIIFIYADDLGAGLLGINGQKIITTPNIDKLAEEGMQFRNSYGNSYCLPARASLLTGLHDCHSNGWNYVPGGMWIEYREGKHSFTEVVDSINKLHGNIPDEEVFLPQLLKNAGYYTAQIGKLEWGFATTPYRLERHGWDYHFGYYDHKDCHGFYPKSLFRNGKEVFIDGNYSPDSKTKGDNYSQELFLEDILKFIRNYSNDGPFFLYHPSQIPHGDIMIPQIHPDFIDNENLTHTQKEYASMVKMLDDHVGIIMKELKLKGIDDNTVVIFSVDNGHEIYYELKHQKVYDSSKSILSDKFDTERDGDIFNGNGNLSGKKFSFWEGGIKVPLIVRWPGKVEPGSETDLLVATYDLMPTLAEIAKIEMPPGKDGISYLPALTGQSDKQIEHDFIINKGSVRYAGHRGAALITGDGWKLRYFEGSEIYMLHNLNSDPKENHDLAMEFPEKLKILKDMFHKEYNSPRRDINY
jgi:arylsulfatase A-like enzyme